MSTECSNTPPEIDTTAQPTPAPVVSTPRPTRAPVVSTPRPTPSGPVGENDILNCLRDHFFSEAGEDRLVWPDDGSTYEYAKRGTNKRSVAYFPDVVIYPQQNKDVQAAVKCARELGLPINAKNGGHSYEIGYVTEGGLMLDMSDMHGLLDMQLSGDGGSVTVEGGMRMSRMAGLILQRSAKTQWGQTFLFGSGTYIDVGAIGHSLCGGFGGWSRKLGYLADQILSLEIVNSYGEVIFVDKDNNPDLFWALRGGCSTAFGIIVSVQFSLYRLQAPVISSAYVLVSIFD